MQRTITSGNVRGLAPWRILMRRQLEWLIGLGWYSQAGDHARLFNGKPCYMMDRRAFGRDEVAL